MGEQESKFHQLMKKVKEAEADAEKFYEKGNAAAGTRLRKYMQDVKVLAQEVRTEVIDKKNN